MRVFSPVILSNFKRLILHNMKKASENTSQSTITNFLCPNIKKWSINHYWQRIKVLYEALQQCRTWKLGYLNSLQIVKILDLVNILLLIEKFTKLRITCTRHQCHNFLSDQSFKMMYWLLNELIQVILDLVNHQIVNILDLMNIFLLTKIKITK